MKRITICPFGIAFVDDEDYKMLKKYKWYSMRYKNKIYPRCNIYLNGRRTTCYMHQLIVQKCKRKIIDHKNRNPLDNRKTNLRHVTMKENAWNRSKQAGASSFKGVCFHKASNKWVAQIQYGGAQYHLGVFESEICAAEEYDAAAIYFFGEYAKLNKEDYDVPNVRGTGEGRSVKQTTECEGTCTTGRDKLCPHPQDREPK